MENFHQRFTRLREQAGLTLQEIADTAGISYQAVQKWEAGKGMPRGAEKQKAVAAILRTTPAYLLYGDEGALSIQTPVAEGGLVARWETDLTDQESVLDAARRVGLGEGEDPSLIELCAALARMLEQKTEECRQLQDRLRQVDPEWGKYS